MRDILESLAPLINAGDPGWRTLFAEAQRIASTITDPFSADDARSRIAVIASYERQLSGDYAGALGWLKEGVAAVDRQRGRVSGEDALRRLNDHECVDQLNICQLAQSVQDWPTAQAALDRLAELAPLSQKPADWARIVLPTRAALFLAQGDLVAALAHYRQAAEVYRAVEPERLGPILLGLAQTQMMMGSFAEAARGLDRAEPLLHGEADLIANLRQARAFIASATGQDSAADLQRAFVGAVTDESLPTHRAEAAKSAAYAHHLEGDLSGARAHFETVVAEARGSGDPDRLANALLRASTATQDLALTTADPVDAEGIHHAALAQLAEAREIVEGLGQPLKFASIDVMHAEYLTQWHHTVDGTTVRLLRSALMRVEKAGAVLRAASLLPGSAAERRDFAALHSARAFDVACELAFSLGDKDTLARLITERAAGYDWRAARP